MTAIVLSVAICVGPGSTASGATRPDECPSVVTSSTVERTVRQNLYTSDAESAPHLSGLVSCATASGAFHQLTNASPVVWALPGTPVAPRGSTILMRAMRTQLAIDFRSQERAVPTYVLPGETVDVLPMDVYPAIDLELTRIWIAFSGVGAPLIEWIDEYTTAAKPSWSAVWACATGAAAFVAGAYVEYVTVDEILEAAFRARETSARCDSLATPHVSARVPSKPPLPLAPADITTPLGQLRSVVGELDAALRPQLARSVLDAICRAAPSRGGC